MVCRWGMYVPSLNCCYMLVWLRFLNIMCSYITYLSMVQIDCDKTIMVTLKHEDKLQDGSECSFQVQIYLSLQQWVFGQSFLPCFYMSNFPCCCCFHLFYFFLPWCNMLAPFTRDCFCVSSLLFFTLPLMAKEESECQLWLCLAQLCWVIYFDQLTWTPSLLAS